MNKTIKQAISVICFFVVMISPLFPIHPGIAILINVVAMAGMGFFSSYKAVEKQDNENVFTEAFLEKNRINSKRAKRREKKKMAKQAMKNGV